MVAEICCWGNILLHREHSEIPIVSPKQPGSRNWNSQFESNWNKLGWILKLSYEEVKVKF